MCKKGGEYGQFNQHIGMSPSEKTTKIHAIVDGLGVSALERMLEE
jgi:hypothetical protein